MALSPTELPERLRKAREDHAAHVAATIKDFAELRALIKDLRPVQIDGTVGFWKWKRQRIFADLIAAYIFPNGTKMPATMADDPVGIEFKGSRADRIRRIEAVGEGRFMVTYHGGRNIVTGSTGAQETLLNFVLLHQNLR